MLVAKRKEAGVKAKGKFDHDIGKHHAEQKEINWKIKNFRILAAQKDRKDWRKEAVLHATHQGDAPIFRNYAPTVYLISTIVFPLIEDRTELPIWLQALLFFL